MLRLLSVFLLFVSMPSQAALIEYDIDFKTGSFSSGFGYFSYDDSDPIGESLDFYASFDVGLEYEAFLEGGGANAVYSFLIGDSFEQGYNFDDSVGFVSLLSIESTGIYCLRNFVGASGTCTEDGGVFEIGSWSITRVLEPSSTLLLLTGLIPLIRRKLC